MTFIAGLIYTNVAFSPSKMYETSINVSNENNEQLVNGFPDQNFDPSTVQLEKQYGDVRLGQRLSVWNTLKPVFGFLPADTVNTDDPLDDNLRAGYAWFVSIFYMLTGIEIVLIVWSKKWS